MIRSNTSNYLNLPPCTNPKKESTYLTHTQQKNTYQHFFKLHNTEINAIKKNIKKYIKDILENQPVYHPVWERKELQISATSTDSLTF
jgi:hypothetical protein